MSKEGTLAICLQVQKTAGHWSQVRVRAGYSKDCEEINTTMYQLVKLLVHKVNFKIDSGANNIICSKDTWIKVGSQNLNQWRLSKMLQMGTQSKYCSS